MRRAADGSPASPAGSYARERSRAGAAKGRTTTKGELKARARATDRAGEPAVAKGRVLEAHAETIFDQSENRLHVQKAVLLAVSADS